VSIAAAIEQLIDEGFTLADAIKAAKIVEAHMAVPVDLRSSNAKRQARFRERRREAEALQSVTSVTPRNAPAERNRSNGKALQSVTEVTPLARVDDSSTTTELSGKKVKNLGPGRNSVTPRKALLECLSPEIADAVLAHRRAMRRPLTGHAAQRLAKGFMATGDPNAAADMMIERGWQGFKPEWFDNERAGNGNGTRHGKRSISDVAPSFIRRIDALYEDRMRSANSGEGGDGPVQLLPPQRGQQS
jgi:hypothetical protein